MLYVVVILLAEYFVNIVHLREVFKQWEDVQKFLVVHVVKPRVNRDLRQEREGGSLLVKKEQKSADF